MVNFITALAYHFCLALPTACTQSLFRRALYGLICGKRKSGVGGREGWTSQGKRECDDALFALAGESGLRTRMSYGGDDVA